MRQNCGDGRIYNPRRRQGGCTKNVGVIYIKVSITGSGRSYYVLSSSKAVHTSYVAVPGGVSNFGRLLRAVQSYAGGSSGVGMKLRTAKRCDCGVLKFLLSGSLTICIVGPLRAGLCQGDLDLHGAGASHISTEAVTAVLLSSMSLGSCASATCRGRRLGSLAECQFSGIHRETGLGRSISELIAVLFPRLRGLIPSLRVTSICTLLDRCPNTGRVSRVRLAGLAGLLTATSGNHCNGSGTVRVQSTTEASVNSIVPTGFLRLGRAVGLVQRLASRVSRVRISVRGVVSRLGPPVLSVPNINVRSTTVVLTRVNSFSGFRSPSGVLTCTNYSPSACRSKGLAGYCTRVRGHNSHCLQCTLCGTAGCIYR